MLRGKYFLLMNTPIPISKPRPPNLYYKSSPKFTTQTTTTNNTTSNTKSKKINPLSSHSKFPPKTSPQHHPKTISHFSPHPSTTTSTLKQSIIQIYKSKHNSPPSQVQTKSTSTKTYFSSRNKHPLPNKYDKYNTQTRLYELSHEYDKINFDNTNFIERMEHYTLKGNLKETKMNEMLQEQKPRISEKQKVDTFNRLIEDSNRRADKKEQMEGITYDVITMKDIEMNSKKKRTKGITDKEWEKIYKERFKDKYDNTQRAVEIIRDAERKRKLQEENDVVKLARNTTTCRKDGDISAINKRLYYAYNKENKCKLIKHKNYKSKTNTYNNTITNSHSTTNNNNKANIHKPKRINKIKYDFDKLLSMDINNDIELTNNPLDDDNNNNNALNNFTLTHTNNNYINNNNNNNNNNTDTFSNTNININFNNIITEDQFNSKMEDLLNDFFTSNIPLNECSFAIPDNNSPSSNLNNEY